MKQRVRLLIFIILFSCICFDSCYADRIKKRNKKRHGKEVKAKQRLRAVTVFFVVTGFMLGYVLTDEYLIEK